MAHLHNLFAAVFLLLVARCLAQSSHKRELARPAEHTQTQYHFTPPAESSPTHGNNQDDLEMLNVVLLASVDGKLHALNRLSGEILWSMSSSDTTSIPSTLGPLVRTQHATAQFTDADDDIPREFYVIEPQSGDIFVMSSSKGPLQRLPFSLPQLVDMSPYTHSEGDNPKIFVGRKETSFLLLELETGKVKATINSECPWDPFEDPFEDLKHAEDELDLDELEGSKPPKVEKPTEVFIGRTDYHISIHTLRLSPSSPKPPVQNLSFSTYGPNNQDNAVQAFYRRTPDDLYIQPSAEGGIMSFRIGHGDRPSQLDSRFMWALPFANPIVAVLDVVKSPSRQHPFVLLQPIPPLQDVFPLVDFGAAAKLNRFPNLGSAYVGMVEETGSLFAMSQDRFPLLAFGGVNDRMSIDQAPETLSSASDLDSITQARKLRKLCDGGALDPRCMTGIHTLELDSQAKFNHQLDGTPSVPLLVPADEAVIAESMLPAIEEIQDEISNLSVTSPWRRWNGSGPSVIELLGQPLQALSTPLWSLVALLFAIGWFVMKKKPGRQSSDRSLVSNVSNAIVSDIQVEKTPTSVANIPTPENQSLLTSNVTELKPTPPSAAEDLPGEDSDKGDMADTPGKRKPIRRRRGKRKKGVAPNDKLDSDARDDEENVAGEGPDSHQDALITPSLPTPKIVAAPTSLVVSDTILGFGSHGTVVFRGSLQGRAVAVKRLLQDFVTLASREVSILEESDDHPNVIRYFYQETHGNFLYIALELCPASLADIIERPDNFKDIAITFEPKRALRQITSGIRHLHALKIVHRDIKPQNILVSSAKKGTGNGGGHRMLISDFGLCKKLEVDQTSFMPTAFGALAAGTVGWRAPEILRGEVRLDDSDSSQMSRGSVSTADGNATTTSGAKPTKLTRSVDIFALGCLFYYSLTGGGHPFGDRFERESNILKDAKLLEGLEHFGEEGSEAVDLIHKMLDPAASQRPNTTSCLLHPYFWDADRRLGFLQDASDRFEIMCREPRERDLVALESDASRVVGPDWRSRLDKAFLENLGKFRKYDGRSVQDLLRALRNKKHHYQDLPENVRRQLNPMPEGYLAYFTRRFPRLFLHVHSVIEGSSLKQESMFRSYFELSEQ